MSRCEHLTWVRLSGIDKLTLHDERRLTRVLTDFTNPELQRPSLLLFVGRKAKSVALRELFPNNNIKRGRHGGIANLRADTSTLSADNPVLFADSDPFSITWNESDITHCHETSVYPLKWQHSETTRVFDLIHGRLFCSFTDVICIFADDFQNYDSVVERLKSWASAGIGFRSLGHVRPRVVIVLNGDEASPTFNILQMEDLQFSLRQQDLIAFFASITVLHLADEQMSPLARHRRLKEVLLRHSDESRQTRTASKTSYTASHLNCLFRHATKHVTEAIEAPFNFIIASHRYSEDLPDHPAHLSTFVRLGTRHGISQNDIASYVASTLLMDAYPPGMHVFDPSSVYEVIYRSSCLLALKNCFRTTVFAEHQSKLIQESLISACSGLEEGNQVTSIQHLNNIRRLVIPWTDFRSNQTCLCCLRRKPENVLSCSHSLCNHCIQTFGEAMRFAEYRYHIESCTLCRSGTAKVALKPPTAGVRILSIDGGGIRGIVPLEYLKVLQDVLGPECPLQDLFDLALGTSSGGLIVLSLFLQNWPIARCIEVFRSLTREFFRRRREQGNIFQHLRHMLRCWLSDGCYDVIALERALKNSFDTRRMFDFPPAISAAKVAVTATTISDASPVLFSNYNGVGVRQRDCGYRHLRPEDPGDEPFVWEAGRSTSAAPILFKTARLNAIGTFQDGGLKHNNPVNLALWESRQIWPSIKKPDLIISLGTGTSQSTNSPSSVNFRHIIQDGFIPRLYRSFMSSLDGQAAWRDLLNHLGNEDRENYFQLNVNLPSEPAIDDITKIDELQLYVYQQPWQEQPLDIITALLISSFFFELDRVPVPSSGAYHCQGVIRCQLKGDVIVSILRRIRRSTWVFLKDTENLGYYKAEEDLCPICGLYNKPVDFIVQHPTEIITLYMQNSLRRRRISGFPHSMEWFKGQQQLGADFGIPSSMHHCCEGCALDRQHDRLKRKCCLENSTRRQQKRPQLVINIPTVNEIDFP